MKTAKTGIEDESTLEKLRSIGDQKKNHVEINNESLEKMELAALALAISSSMLLINPADRLFVLGIVELAVAALLLWHS